MIWRSATSGRGLQVGWRSILMHALCPAPAGAQQQPQQGEETAAPGRPFIYCQLMSEDGDEAVVELRLWVVPPAQEQELRQFALLPRAVLCAVGREVGCRRRLLSAVICVPRFLMKVAFFCFK